MKKEEFLSTLRQSLAGLPAEDVEKSLAFYSEAIDDRMENGRTEEEAILDLGSTEEIVKEILSETSLPKLIRQRVKSDRNLKTWEVVLLVLGSPVWLPLLLAAAVVGLSVYFVIWSLVLALYAVILALAISGVVFLLKSFSAWFLVGPGLTMIGAAILLFFAANRASGGILLLSKKYLLWIKRLFVKKEAEV